jgi:hypothetical protein
VNLAEYEQEVRAASDQLDETIVKAHAVFRERLGEAVRAFTGKTGKDEPADEIAPRIGHLHDIYAVCNKACPAFRGY